MKNPEPFRFNTRITVGEKILKSDKWLNKTPVIGDFVHEDGTFRKHTDFQIKYNISVNFVTYAGCVMSIQKYITKMEKNVYHNARENINTCLKNIQLFPKGSKQYYNVLIANKFEPNCKKKWEEKLQNPDINWKECFEDIARISDIKLKWYQLRLTHRIIGTNTVLEKMGVVKDNKCNFCQNQRDSIYIISFGNAKIFRGSGMTL